MALVVGLIAVASPPSRLRAQQAPLTLEQLRNATYPSQFTANKTAPLDDGEYREQAAPGSASQVVVTFIDAAIGPEFAAVVVATSGGGSGTFYMLHLVTAGAGAPAPGPGVLLGDRIRLLSIELLEGQAQVHLVTQGPDDPFCCPSQEVVQRYARSGGVFTLQTSTIVPPASGSAGLANPSGGGRAGPLALLVAGAAVVLAGRGLTRGRRLRGHGGGCSSGLAAPGGVAEPTRHRTARDSRGDHS